MRPSRRLQCLTQFLNSPRAAPLAPGLARLALALLSIQQASRFLAEKIPRSPMLRSFRGARPRANLRPFFLFVPPMESPSSVRVVRQAPTPLCRDVQASQKLERLLHRDRGKRDSPEYGQKSIRAVREWLGVPDRLGAVPVYATSLHRIRQQVSYSSLQRPNQCDKRRPAIGIERDNQPRPNVASPVSRMVSPPGCPEFPFL